MKRVYVVLIAGICHHIIDSVYKTRKGAEKRKEYLEKKISREYSFIHIVEKNLKD